MISYEASASCQSYKIGESGSSKHKHGPEHGSQNGKSNMSFQPGISS